MKRYLTSIIFGFGVFSMLTLTVLSLLTRRYFSLSNLEEVKFGLSGCVISGNFESYSSLTNSCDSSHVLSEVCGNLENLKTAGTVLKVVLVLDLIILLCFIISLVISKAIIQPSIRKALTRGREAINALHDRKVVKVYELTKHSLYLHPVLVLGGLVTWILLCKFSDMKGNVILEDGIAILIVSLFLAMFGTAIYFYYVKQINIKNKKRLNKPEKIELNSVNVLISV